MSSFTSSFTTSIAKQPTLWSASLKKKVDQRRAAVEEKEQRTNAIPWAGGDGTSEPNNIRSSMGRSYFLLLI
jgi:hypothetical protein